MYKENNLRRRLQEFLNNRRLLMLISLLCLIIAIIGFIPWENYTHVDDIGIEDMKIVKSADEDDMYITWTEHYRNGLTFVYPFTWSINISSVDDMDMTIGKECYEFYSNSNQEVPVMWYTVYDFWQLKNYTIDLVSFPYLDSDFNGTNITPVIINGYEGTELLYYETLDDVNYYRMDYYVDVEYQSYSFHFTMEEGEVIDTSVIANRIIDSITFVNE